MQLDIFKTEQNIKSKPKVKVDFTLVWKYDINGNERPLKEQLLRRKGDLNIIEDKIKFYKNHTFHSNALKKRASEKANQKHYNKVFRDVESINKKLSK